VGSLDTMMEDTATHSLVESFQYRPFLSIIERRSISAVDFPSSKSPVITSISQSSIMANQSTSSSSQPTNNAVNMSSPAKANRESILSKMLSPDESALEEEEAAEDHDSISLDILEDTSISSEDVSISSAEESSSVDSSSGGGATMEDTATHSLVESFHDSHPFLSIIKKRRSRRTSVDFPSKSSPVVTTTSQSIMANQNSTTCCSSQPTTNSTVNVSSPPKANRESILSRKHQAEPTIRNTTRTLEGESTRRDMSRSALVAALKKSRMQQQQQQQQQQQRRIQFAEDVKIHEITPLQKALVHDMFYSEDSLADMRYEAFMESCGLDPSDFEYKT
jgi:hypothetical protein